MTEGLSSSLRIPFVQLLFLLTWLCSPVLTSRETSHVSCCKWFCFHMYSCTYIHVAHLFSEIDEQTESSTRSSQTFSPFAVAFGVTLTTCTLLFRQLLYSQYYEFSVLNFFVTL
ncbi:unnamed protein product [Pipistrellus nathusii]|uniref:Uncharacterized protein n=1 Tax=Pipistrellus nathusii TaxID=59473 RepID=A0ABP0A688_PIPNA